MNVRWPIFVAAVLAAGYAFSLDVTLAPAGDIRFGDGDLRGVRRDRAPTPGRKSWSLAESRANPQQKLNDSKNIMGRLRDGIPLP